MARRAKYLGTAWLLLGLGGCSTEVALHNPTIPEPLVAPIPIVVGVRYPEAFDHFVHEEQVIGREKWQIDLGQSNKLLFNQLFGSLFGEVKLIDREGDAASFGVDALIEPTIDAFEFSVPEQSQTDSFAVWIRYRIRIYDNQGTQIANWPISAYGKSLTTTFGGDDALRRAAVLAMRDAAALIIMQLDRTTGISSLAKAKAESANGSEAAIQTSAVEEQDDDTG